MSNEQNFVQSENISTPIDTQPEQSENDNPARKKRLQVAKHFK